MRPNHNFPFGQWETMPTTASQYCNSKQKIFAVCSVTLMLHAEMQATVISFAVVYS